MPDYHSMTRDELQAEMRLLQKRYQEIVAQGLSLNMARGKPSDEQLDLSMPLLSLLTTENDCMTDGGLDCRNYGILCGIPEAQELMASILDDNPENILIYGNASLTAMFDTLSRFWIFGTQGYTPWCQLENVSWLCPTPGYDRHFAITEAFGIKMIPIPLTEEGPDMDQVEELVQKDASIKGIWCVPKYSNPSGITYSDEVVSRLARMKTAACDFKIFWDNAYAVHHFFDEEENQDHLLDIGDECVKAGAERRFVKFSSTSKITFPGAGISALAAHPTLIDEFKKTMGVQTIGHDKLNQKRHALFLKDARGIHKHMMKHAAILRPKFELVEKKLTEGLSDIAECHWSQPRGGYFVSFDAPSFTARRIVELAKEAGVTMTDAGATYPYQNDPLDSNIRIAPTLPPLEELAAALDVFVVCVRLALAERELACHQ